MPEPQWLRAVLPLVRYYRSPLWYYRKAGAVQGWEGTDIKITSVATSAELESM